MTTTNPEDIDGIEAEHGYRLKTFPELRTALYEVARQNARYRRSLAPDKPLPVIDFYMLTMVDMQQVIEHTHDEQMVNTIESATERRLYRLPEFRHGMFAIAKQGIAYRLAARQSASSVQV